MSALPRNHPDRQVAKPEAPGKHVAEDEGLPDYDDPADLDYLSFDPRFGRGETVVLGKTGSPDNPKRYAEIGDDGQVLDLDTDEPLPEFPTGEELGELDDGRKSTYEQVLERVKARETIENLESAGKETVRLVEGLRLPDRVEPTGTQVGTPDRPVVLHAPREGLHGGELLVAPAVVWLLSHYGVEKVRTWVAGRQATGERDAGD